MSPTIFREDGFRFFFFSREEPRLHVHIHCADGEAKFWLEPQIELAHNFRLNDRQLRSIQKKLRNMNMKSAPLGQNTLAAEVTNVSVHGFWLLLGTEELFVSFEQFPWFRSASIGMLTHVVWPSPNHLYWPDLDVDLAVGSIRHPEQFPLVSRVAP